MAKLNVNQKVIRKSDGKEGVIRAREVKSVENYTDVKYLVDFGDGIENWAILTRKEMKPQQNPKKGPKYIVRKYDVGDGKMVTMAAFVETMKNSDTVYDDDLGDFLSYTTKGKVLSIGFSIYNGSDEYDFKIGEKYAIHRCKTNPFTMMSSLFSGEFNDDTVNAIMDVKAKYIIDNIDNFYRPQ